MALLSRLRPVLGSPQLYASTARRRQAHSRSDPFDVLASEAHPLQIYVTPITDPYLNLSIEHYLLQRSHPSSTLLFLYTNRPCVVIGRNQNPWVETNLALLRGSPAPPRGATPAPIDLIRRRSGGGAVFHDEGNTNWTVICPPAAFTRTKHGEMVVRALHRLGVTGARVNARHDIVVPAPAASSAAGAPTDVKVSGSAYKLTRLRALHHGTCLLRSPNLGRLSGLLRGPAAAFIRARGVESVRSPVANVERAPDAFAAAVRAEFEAMYPGAAAVRTIDDGGGWAVPHELARGYDELKVRRGLSRPFPAPKSTSLRGFRSGLQSREWVYGQTPQFTFSTHPSEDDPRERPRLPESLPRDVSSLFRPHTPRRLLTSPSSGLRSLYVTGRCRGSASPA